MPAAVQKMTLVRLQCESLLIRKITCHFQTTVAGTETFSNLILTSPTT